MPPGSSCSRIVRSWTDPYAPTGEGGYYQTEDGRVWRTRHYPGYESTGDQWGRRRGDHICPFSHSVDAGSSGSAPPAPKPARRARFFQHATKPQRGVSP